MTAVPSAGSGEARRRGWVAHVAPSAIIAMAVVFLYVGLVSGAMIESHEGRETYFRVAQYRTEIDSGNFPPHLFPDAVKGAGYAFPHYYPPLAYYATVAIANAVDGTVVGTNASFLLSVLLSGFAAYGALWYITRNAPAALAGALVYVSLPYRLLDVFVRGALAESWSFVWFPLLVAGAWAILRRHRFTGLLAVAFGGLLLTHTLSALLTLPMLAAPVVVAFVRRAPRDALRIVTEVALGIALAAWFLVPQQATLDDVWVSDASYMEATDAAVEAKATPLLDLVGSWRNAFRGYDGLTRHGIECPLTFCGRIPVLGLGHYIAVGFSVAAIFAAVFARVRAREREREMPFLVKFLVALLVAWLVSVIFVVAPVPYLFVLPDVFSYVQFPWRALAPAAFLAAAMLSIAATHLGDRRRVPITAAVVAAICVALVPSAQRQPDTNKALTDASITAKSIAKRGNHGFTAQAEFMPIEVEAYAAGTWIPDEPEIRGEGDVVTWERPQGELLRATVRLQEPSVVVLPAVRYDFLEVRVDGETADLDDDVPGVLAAHVDAGTHELSVHERTTRAALVGVVVTFLAWCVLGVIWVPRARAWRAERRAIRDPESR